MKKNGRWRQTKYIVSDEYAFVYFVIPKVACSSIKAALLPCFGIEGIPHSAYTVHDLFDSSQHQLDKAAYLSERERYRAFYKFVFVRNPWDRLVSCWRQKLDSGGQGLGRESYAGQRLHVGMSFPQFARAVCCIPDEESNNHFRSQHVVACGNGHRKPLLVDFVGRFERLEEDFSCVARTVGADLELPHLLSSNSSDHREFYDKGLAQAVGERYRLDAEIFDYRF